MRLINIIVILFLFSYLKGQEIHIDIGTKWIYEQLDFAFLNPDDFILIEIDRDTLIQDERLLIANEYYLTRTETGIDSGLSVSYLIKVDSSQILHYDLNVDSLILLYDFDVMIGDEYEVALGPQNYMFSQEQISSVLMHVSHISFETIENNTWELQHLDPVGFHAFTHIKPIIKGIGGQFHLFPSYGVVDPPPGGTLLCFDNGSQYYPSQLACDLVLNDQKSSFDRLAIYPNPTHGKIDIGYTFEAAYLYNMQGQLIARDSKGIIDISHAPPGQYILHRISDSGPVLVDQIIKVD